MAVRHSWLELERWLVNSNASSAGVLSPFTQASVRAPAWARDEHNLTRWLRREGQLARIDAWRLGFITRQDFLEIRAAGLTSVRLPFGYWTVSADLHPSDYHTGLGLRHLDDAMRWAAEANLSARPQVMSRMWAASPSSESQGEGTNALTRGPCDCG